MELDGLRASTSLSIVQDQDRWITRSGSLGDRATLTSEDVALVRAVGSANAIRVGKLNVDDIARIYRLLRIGILTAEPLGGWDGPPFVDPPIGHLFGKGAACQQSAVALIGLPWDFAYGTRGAALGPQVLRSASVSFANAESGWFSYDLGREILMESTLVDLGDCNGPLLGSRAEVSPYVHRAISSALELDFRPVSIGGDHSLTLHVLEALENQELVFLHIDAHDDVFDQPDLNHGTFIRHVVSLPHVTGVYMAGLRGTVPVQNARFLHEKGINYLSAERWRRQGHRHLVESLPDKPVYISIDLDVLDPSYFPATRALRGGGVSPSELRNLITDLCAVREVLGVDMMELASLRHDHDWSAHYAVELLLHLADLMGLKQHGQG